MPNISFKSPYLTKNNINKRDINFKGYLLADIGGGNGPGGREGKYANITLTYKSKENPGDSFSTAEKGDILVRGDTPKMFLREYAKTIKALLKKYEIINQDGKSKEPIKFHYVIPAAIRRNKEGNQLTVSPPCYEEIKTSDINDALRNTGLNFAKISLSNDGWLHGTNAYNYLCKNSKYKKLLDTPERTIPVVFPGGGCGVAEIRTQKNREALIVATEKGHEHFPEKMIKPELLMDRERKILANGGVLSPNDYCDSAFGLIRNYAKTLGFDDNDIKRLIRTNNARIVTQHAIELDKTTESNEISDLENLCKPDSDSNGNPLKPLFKETKLSGNKKTFALLNPKTGEPFTQQQHNDALKVAGTEFFKGVGVIAAGYVMGGHTDTVVISSKLSQYIKQALEGIKENPEKIVKDACWKRLDGVGKDLLCNDHDGLNVIIENTGEPCTIENAKTILDGEDIGGEQVKIKPENLNGLLTQNEGFLGLLKPITK